MASNASDKGLRDKKSFKDWSYSLEAGDMTGKPKSLKAGQNAHRDRKKGPKVRQEGPSVREEPHRDTE